MNANGNGATVPNGTFEMERAHLLDEVGQSMEQCVNNLNELNRNMADLVEVGQDFTRIADVWADFYSRVTQKNDVSGSIDNANGK